MDRRDFMKNILAFFAALQLPFITKTDGKEFSIKVPVDDQSKPDDKSSVGVLFFDDGSTLGLLFSKLTISYRQLFNAIQVPVYVTLDNVCGPLAVMEKLYKQCDGVMQQRDLILAFPVTNSSMLYVKMRRAIGTGIGYSYSAIASDVYVVSRVDFHVTDIEPIDAPEHLNVPDCFQRS